MRGEVLHYDETQGFGFITGADGNRYTFRREDMRRSFSATKGMMIEFRESGTQARDVIPVGPEPDSRGAGASVSSVPAPAAPPPLSTAGQNHFGRNANATDSMPAMPAPSLGLWGYFWNCMTVNYAGFRGRARRKEYWAFVLFSTLALLAIAFAGVMVDAFLGNFDPYGDGPIAVMVAVGLAILAGFLPGIAVTTRRFHDVGMSGWFYLLFFLLSFVTIGGLIILVVTLIPSQKRDNKWGPIPEGVPIPPPYNA